MESIRQKKKFGERECYNHHNYVVPRDDDGFRTELRGLADELDNVAQYYKYVAAMVKGIDETPTTERDEQRDVVQLWFKSVHYGVYMFLHLSWTSVNVGGGNRPF